MGAVNFSIDAKLLTVLSEALPLEVFVETGTFKGAAIEIAKDFFKKIYSVELSKEYYEQAKNKYQDNAQIKIFHGNSGEILSNIAQDITQQSVLFWLDAHWCVASNTAGELSQCPLLAEIQALHGLNENSIIVIDDARLFLSAPPKPHEITHWPDFDQIIRSLYSLSSQHHICVVNDCIVFYPARIEATIRKFAHDYGIDWLSVLDKSRDYDKLLQQLIEKEEQINLLKSACDDRDEFINKHLGAKKARFLKLLSKLKIY